MVKTKARSKLFIAVCVMSVLLLIVFASIAAIYLQTSEQFNQVQELKFIDEVIERQRIKHEGVELARAKLPQDSVLTSDWNLEQAMAIWQSNQIETLATIAKQFVHGQKDISSYDLEKLTQFTINSLEISELLEAIEHGLCEISLDPAKGQWQISNDQIKSLKSMTYMLAARSILLSDKGDSQGALKTILNSYSLMDVLLEVPNVKLQAYRPDMLIPIAYAIRRGVRPDEIPGDSKVTFLNHLKRQSSKEPIINALKLHEALVLQDVTAKHSNFMRPWLLAGYHHGIESLVQLLDEPQLDAFKQGNKIVNDAPIYAGQTKWRLQNVASDVLRARNNTKQHAKSVSDFLHLEEKKP